jgi:hypothetical protein
LVQVAQVKVLVLQVLLLQVQIQYFQLSHQQVAVVEETEVHQVVYLVTMALTAAQVAAVQDII